MVNLNSSSRSPWLTALILLGLAALYLCSARYLVQHALPNSDEGFYAYVSQEVMHGRVPYRDFAYTQTPLLPYLQGAVMSVTGFGMREQRWINAAGGLAAMLLAVFLWRRRGLDWLHCTALVVVWSLCVSLVYYTVIGKTYAWAGLWLVVAAAALCIRDRPWTTLTLVSIAGVMAVGCRLTTAPAVFILWLGLVVTQRTRISSQMLIALPLLTALVALAPFVAADPRNAYFWTMQYHLLSALPAQRLGIFWLSIGIAPVVAVLGAVGSIAALRNLREPGSWIVLAGAIGWVVAVVGPGVYADYAAPCFPLVLTGAGCLLAQLRLTESRVAQGLPLLLAALALGGLFLKREDYFLDGYLDAVDHTAAFVQAHTQPNDPILTPMPEIAVSAGRKILPGLELGKFGLTVEMDDATASRRHILTLGQLTQAIESHAAPVIVLSQLRNGNFLWSVPSLAQFNHRTRQELFAKMLESYACTCFDDYFLVFELKAPNQKTYPVDPAAL